MTRAILFDFNGVIIDDEPQHCQALTETLAEYGITLERERYYREYLGFDDRECFRFTFERHGRPADASTVAEAIERKARHYSAAIRRSMTLVPGAADFVRASAADGLALALVSGALKREIEAVLDAVGLRRYFGVIIAAEDVSESKPDPQGYIRALRMLPAEAADCVGVEDSLPGLAAARAAGLRCAALTTSHSADALAEADAVWADLAGRKPSDLPWAHAAP